MPAHTSSTRQASSRRSLAWLVGWTVLLLTAPVFAATHWQAQAMTGDGSPFSAMSVGTTVTLDLGLLAAGPSIPPASYDLVVEWGADRAANPTTQIGALEFLAGPSILDGGPLAPASDCATGIGALAGTCSFAIDVADTTPAGSRPLVRLDFLFDWVLPTGFEMCDSPLDAGCFVAEQSFQLVIDERQAGGSLQRVGTISGGSLGTPYIRPIPEPSTLAMLGLGLAVLGTLRRPGTKPRT